MLRSLCDDLQRHVAGFLTDPIDLLNLDAVLPGVVASSAWLRGATRRLAWTYADPPRIRRFHVDRVVEVASLEPQYAYRSFVCVPPREDAPTMPPLRVVRGQRVVHVHASWILEPSMPTPADCSRSPRPHAVC